MLQSIPDPRDPQRGAATGTVVLVISFMLLAFVTAITIAVYTFTQAPAH